MTCLMLHLLNRGPILADERPDVRYYTWLAPAVGTTAPQPERQLATLVVLLRRRGLPVLRAGPPGRSPRNRGRAALRV